ncbi:DNA-binding transcriptional response regulator, NtrC family [Haloferula helveola]|uniref:DNA-binding transcriptional response regulator, NtrC family n=1 Tax=Haloferula helveola TaxID=490095 RepID=A0ABN6H9J2_9BACT|nr:DNA-binding transcriptional response regulator, NtrC family [Haloferula helveola]
MAASKLLIVEDHHALAVAIAAAAERSGLETRLAPSLARARELLQAERFNGLVLDIGLPDGHGLDLVENWQWPDKPEIAVITAHGEIENAIKARKIGIARFLDKPVDFDELQSFFELVAAAAEPDQPAESAPSPPSPFVGAAPSMRPVFRQISHACASDQPVVVCGATGTGRTQVATLIRQSANRGGPFRVLHASAQVTENELRDAVTGSRGGHLIIESVAALPHELQAQLIHTLDTETESAPRLIVTTGEEGLLEHVNEGSFEQELYYRLQILEVSLPPLKERIDDIPAIAACFLGELDSTTHSRIDPEVFDIFTRYDWPGNLRELRNVINFALVTSAGSSRIGIEHIPDHLSGIPAHHAKDDALSHALDCWVDRNLGPETEYKELSAELEGLLLRLLLRRFDGKPSHLAAALSINRSTLRKKLKQAVTDD